MKNDILKKTMKIEPKTLKGFRDFLPKEARKRQYAINILRSVFESYGFEPLETPALEYEEILLGKYGEEGDKLMYRFEDLGKRRVALRYDQTVPLARVVAQYSPRSGAGQNELVMPFKRYQIQPVWRAENTQKGRFREFLQCDADIIGLDTPLSDAETILVAAKSLEKLGFKNFKILINDRSLLNFDTKAIAIIDKLKKVGREEVLRQLISSGFIATGILKDAEEWLTNIETQKPTNLLKNTFFNLEKLGISKEKYEFSPTLARGLDYYTSTIFEIEIDGYTAGSVCGGGRYGNLIGMFAGRDIPAVGFAFGFDRLIETMEQLNLFPADLDITTKVLVTIFSPEFKDKSIEVSSRLRSNNISTELYLNENVRMDKQMRYANQKNIPYVLIIGPEEVEKNTVTVRDMKTREQKMMTLEEIIKKLK